MLTHPKNVWNCCWGCFIFFTLSLSLHTLNVCWYISAISIVTSFHIRSFEWKQIWFFLSLRMLFLSISWWLFNLILWRDLRLTNCILIHFQMPVLFFFSIKFPTDPDFYTDYLYLCKNLVAIIHQHKLVSSNCKQPKRGKETKNANILCAFI